MKWRNNQDDLRNHTQSLSQRTVLLEIENAALKAKNEKLTQENARLETFEHTRTFSVFSIIEILYLILILKQSVRERVTIPSNHTSTHFEGNSFHGSETAVHTNG